MHLLADQARAPSPTAPRPSISAEPRRHRRAVRRRQRARLPRRGARAAGGEHAFPSLRLANLLRLGHPCRSTSTSRTRWRRRSWSSCGCSAAAATGPTASSRWPPSAASAASPLALPARRRPAGRRAGGALAACRRTRSTGCGATWCEGGIDNARRVPALRRLADRPRRARGGSRGRCCTPASTGRASAPPTSRRCGRALARADAPVAALVFYRALVQAGNLAVVDALIEALAARRAERRCRSTSPA